MAESNGEESGSADAFADALAELKERGSLLLLSGADNGVVEGTCERLLGQHGPDLRRRLFVLTDRSPTHAQSVEPTRLITYRLPVRSTAASSAGGGVPGRTVDGGLDDLEAAIADAVEEIDREAGGLEPAELRVCLDSADCLLGTHGPKALSGFLDALSETVRDARGMCHVHLHREVEAEKRRRLRPRFDAVIETRPDGRERWHLQEPEFTTDWLAP